MEQKRKRANLCNKHPIKTFSHNATQPKQLKSLRTNNECRVSKSGKRGATLLSTVAYLTSCKNVSWLEKPSKTVSIYYMTRGGVGKILGRLTSERWGIKDFRLVD